MTQALRKHARREINTLHRALVARDTVGLTRLQAIPAYGLAVFYCGPESGGELISHVSPGIIRKHARL